MKILKGLKLLCSNPKSFVIRLRQMMAVSRTKRRLGLLTAEGEGPAWIRHGDIEFPFDPRDRDEQQILYHAFFQEWQDDTRRLFSPHVRPGNTVIDVGANLGFTSLVLNRLVGATGHVHSFEPGRLMFTRLQQMVQRNGLSRVSLHHVGCGERSEKLTLNIPASSGNASLRGSDEILGETQLTESVQIEPLDLFVGDSLKALHFIKIDTEGFEIDVLRGAVRTIERLRPVICIELSSEYADSSAASIDWLTERGYTFPIHPDLEQCRNGDNFIALP